MSSPALKKLSIEHLRGAVQPFHLSFEKGKKLTVVYGENATGKTTICDALEFLGDGKVGSLEGRGLGRTQPYWHSVGKTPGDVAVTLETRISSCTGRIAKGGVTVVPADQRPKVRVLRRSQILSLLEAPAAERYAAIRRFIGVAGVEASEGALRGLIRELKSNREIAVARVQENNESIVQHWQSAGAPGLNALSWAEQEAARDEEPLQHARRDLSNLRTAYSQLVEYPERLQAASAAVHAAGETQQDAERRLEQALQNAVQGAGEVVAILEAARPYLTEHPSPEACPLCESSERAQELGARVEERLTQFRELRDARQTQDRANDTVQTAERERDALQERLAEHVTAYTNAFAKREWDREVDLPEKLPPVEGDALRAWLAATAHLPQSWEQLESTWAALGQTIGTLRRALETYRSNAQAQKDLDVLLPRLERTLEVIVEERLKFTDSVLEDIANDVGRLYEKVHPGEGLDKIRLELDAARRASLEIEASFETLTNTPPQAYFSQSHLDTLGLCIFLALAARDGSDDTILVLDDVLASVDEPHVERTIKMLYDEATRFRHCIMTTHYGPWRYKQRWGWLRHGQCQFVELKKWSFDDGLQLMKSAPPDIERLSQLLQEDSPDPQLVCAKAGVVLEAALTFIAQLYECRLPFRAEARYTLGELLSCISSKLRQALIVDVPTATDSDGTYVYRIVALGPILDELQRMAQARNVFGAHFNQLAQYLPDEDAVAFGKQVRLLVDALVHPEDGWPSSDKSGSYWSTANESRRLHPLKKPS